ncbi:cytochrome b561 [Aquabacterium commune]|uniref:Cytochrome b561 n=1 Tax=Aquabacterium commune TaxID=70586 RepID=A0A4R6R9Y5_9BURK|nr:cytochrome b [Aquabacterium commune]TDP82891.1 cytochrome b561 [Aquabacterium commune]
MTNPSQPNLTAASPRYTAVAMLLHWVLAVAILTAFLVGLYVEDLPFSPNKLKLINWHKWAGVTILALSLLRLVWRLTHRPPALPARITQAMPSWQRVAHHGTHHLMYLLFFAVPLLGWAYSSAKGYPIVWFGVLALPDFVSPDPALADAIKPLHALAAWGLIGLVALHVAAALKHQFIDRDGLLDRMRPGR